jgi:hypothetical protein
VQGLWLMRQKLAQDQQQFKEGLLKLLVAQGFSLKL